jgi:hypothetical protein
MIFEPEVLLCCLLKKKKKLSVSFKSKVKPYFQKNIFFLKCEITIIFWDIVILVAAGIEIL